MDDRIDQLMALLREHRAEERADAARTAADQAAADADSLERYAEERQAHAARIEVSLALDGQRNVLLERIADSLESIEVAATLIANRKEEP